MDDQERKEYAAEIFQDVEDAIGKVSWRCRLRGAHLAALERELTVVEEKHGVER